MDKLSNFIIILLITVSIFTNAVYIKSKDVEAINNVENIEHKSYKEKLIRFHVLANSDSPEDQELKLKVRDKVIESMSDKFKESKSIDETRAIVNENIESMTQVALEEIKENGKDYDVQIKLEPYNFPTKSYGNFTLPAGEYEAVRVLIGSAKGQNWWCVMFPPLCFVDAKSATTDNETTENMKKHLTQEEYNAISSSENGKIELRSKLVETIKEWMAS